MHSAYHQPGEYSLGSLLVWLVVAMLLPLLGGALTASEVALGTLHLAGGWAFGALVLKRVKTVAEMSSVTRGGVALLVGTFLLYPLLFAISSVGAKTTSALAGIAIIAVAGATHLRRVSLTLPPASEMLAVITALLVTVLMSVANGELLRALVRFPFLFASEEISASPDSDYFTSIVATMRHGTVGSAVYEVGAPLAYHVLSFFPPSLFAAATASPSHVALWGVWMPLYKVLGLLLIAEVSNRFIGRREWQPVWRDALIVGLFILLSPLHPLYIFKLVPRNFVWLGAGWLTGGGNPPVTAGIIWAALALAAVFPKRAGDEPSKRDLVLLLAVLATLIAVKVPMFFAVGVFLTAVAFVRALRGRRALLFTVMAAAPFAVAIYAWSFRGAATVASFRVGYLPTYFARLAGVNGEGWHVLVIGSFVGVAVFVVWGSIRWSGIAVLCCLKESPSLVRRRREAAIATVVTLFGCSLLATTTSLTARGGVIDTSFDLNQFPRMAFFLISIFGVAGVGAFLASRKIPPIYRRAGLAVVGLWCSLAAVPLVLNNLRHPPPSATFNRWLASVRGELKERKPVRMAIDPSKLYPGLLLTASDLTPFWVAQQGMRESATTQWRADSFFDALSPQPERQAAACAVFNSQGVDAVIATPETEQQVERFARRCDYRRMFRQRWIWRRVE